MLGLKTLDNKFVPLLKENNNKNVKIQIKNYLVMVNSYAQNIKTKTNQYKT